MQSGRAGGASQPSATLTSCAVAAAALQKRDLNTMRHEVMSGNLGTSISIPVPGACMQMSSL